MDSTYKAILQDAPAGFYDWDIHKNTQQYSDSYKAMFGFDDGDFHEGSKFYDFLLEEDKQKATNKFHEHVSSQGKIPYDIELRYRHKNGSIIWLRSTGRVIEWAPDGQPLRMVGSHIDITRQKAIEEELRKKEAILNETAQLARVGGWEIDLINHKITWSAIIKQIIEVPDDYEPSYNLLTGEGMQFINEGEHRDNAINAVRNAVATGQPGDLELLMTTAKGNQKWVRAIVKAEFKDGVCQRLYGTYQDIDEQRRTRNSLAISEAQFRVAFEYSAFGMLMASPDAKITRANKRFIEMLGYSEQELVKMYTRDITHPDDLELTSIMMTELLSNRIETYLIEKRYLHKTGRIVWCLVSITVVRDVDGTILHFIGQYTDVTDRKKAGDELRVMNNELTALLRSSTHVCIISTDINGIIKHFNRGAQRMLGYAENEVVDRSSLLAFHDPAEVHKRGEELTAQYDTTIDDFEVFITQARQNRYETREWTYIKKAGSTFPAQVTVTGIADEDGNITGFLAIAFDISEIKRVESELRESKQQWQFALEGTGDGLWDMNLITNQSYHSKECKAMVGYSDDDPLIARTDWESRIHPDDRERHDSELEQYLSGKIPVYANEHRARCKDGTYKWILDRGKIIEWDESGRPARMIGTHSDISERKEREEHQKKTLSLISEQNNRLLNFAHIVSHNLRSHSGNFQMLLTMFSDPDIDADEKEVILQHLNNVSDKLNDTITNLNDVVTIQTSISEQRSVVNLYEYVSNTINALAGDISKYKATIKNNVEKDCEIEYNPAYLESILLNFITNTIKYRNPDVKPLVMISCEKQDGHHILQISDNGLGIDLARQGEKLFGMYKTFHGNKDAKGIGLFIAKNQVEAMGGHIEVESEVGKGSTFKIWLS